MTNYEFYGTMLLEDIEQLESKNYDSTDILNELDKDYHFFNENTQTMIGAFSKWLKQEYVPPYLLTKGEKAILENLRYKFKLVQKVDAFKVNVLEENEKGGNILYYFNLKFECLEENKLYKISDILSNCVVKPDIDF